MGLETFAVRHVGEGGLWPGKRCTIQGPLRFLSDQQAQNPRRATDVSRVCDTQTSAKVTPPVFPWDGAVTLPSTGFDQLTARLRSSNRQDATALYSSTRHDAILPWAV